MNKSLLIAFLALCMTISGNTLAVTIIQCEQPDGSIEFTNQGCSKSNSLHSKRTFSRDFSQSQATVVKKKRVKKNSRKQAPFKRSDFVHLQNKLLDAQTLEEMEKHAQTITDKIRSSAQQGKINAAFDMAAATYAKLSKYLKKRQWQGQSVAEYTFRIRTLFEEILITQSTISTDNELQQAIQSAWQKYRATS